MRGWVEQLLSSGMMGTVLIQFFGVPRQIDMGGADYICTEQIANLSAKGTRGEMVQTSHFNLPTGNVLGSSAAHKLDWVP